MSHSASNESDNTWDRAPGKPISLQSPVQSALKENSDMSNVFSPPWEVSNCSSDSVVMALPTFFSNNLWTPPVTNHSTERDHQDKRSSFQELQSHNQLCQDIESIDDLSSMWKPGSTIWSPHSIHSDSPTPTNFSSQSQSGTNDSISGSRPLKQSICATPTTEMNSSKALLPENSHQSSISKTLLNTTIMSSGDAERMHELINTIDGWRADTVDQKTAWKLSDNPEDQSNRMKPTVESNVWTNEPPDGTGLWEKYYENLGEITSRWSQPSLSSPPPNLLPNKVPPVTIPQAQSAGVVVEENESEWSPNKDNSMDAKKSGRLPVAFSNAQPSYSREAPTRSNALARLKEYGYSSQDATNALLRNNMIYEKALVELQQSTARLTRIPGTSAPTMDLFHPMRQPGLMSSQNATNRTSSNSSMSQQAYQQLKNQELSLLNVMENLKQIIKERSVNYRGGQDVQYQLMQLQRQYQKHDEVLKAIRMKLLSITNAQPNHSPYAPSSIPPGSQRLPLHFGQQQQQSDALVSQLSDMKFTVSTNDAANDMTAGNAWNEGMTFPVASNEIHEKMIPTDERSLSYSNAMNVTEAWWLNNDKTGFPESTASSSSLFNLPMYNMPRNVPPPPPAAAVPNQTFWILVRNLPSHISPDTLRSQLLQSQIHLDQFHPNVSSHWILIGILQTEDLQRAIYVLHKILPSSCLVEQISQGEVVVKMKELQNLASRFSVNHSHGGALHSGNINTNPMNNNTMWSLNQNRGVIAGGGVGGGGNDYPPIHHSLGAGGRDPLSAVDLYSTGAFGGSYAPPTLSGMPNLMQPPPGVDSNSAAMFFMSLNRNQTGGAHNF